MTELVAVGDLPVSKPGPALSLKRSRDDDSSPSTSSSSCVATPLPTEFRPIAGTGRLQQPSLPAYSRIPTAMPTLVPTGGLMSHALPQESLHHTEGNDSAPQGYQDKMSWSTIRLDNFTQPPGEDGSLGGLMASWQSLPSQGSTQPVLRFNDRYGSLFGRNTLAEHPRTFAEFDSATIRTSDGGWFTGPDVQPDDAFAHAGVANDALTLLSSAPNSMECVPLFFCLFP